jgi:hypothetical protein
MSRSCELRVRRLAVAVVAAGCVACSAEDADVVVGRQVVRWMWCVVVVTWACPAVEGDVVGYRFG